MYNKSLSQKPKLHYESIQVLYFMLLDSTKHHDNTSYCSSISNHLTFSHRSFITQVHKDRANGGRINWSWNIPSSALAIKVQHWGDLQSVCDGLHISKARSALIRMRISKTPFYHWGAYLDTYKFREYLHLPLKLIDRAKVRLRCIDVPISLKLAIFLSL